MKEIFRLGAYGVLIKDSKILFTLKKKGPYKDCWDLPGGGIEFKETPEEALKRELIEETALEGTGLELLCVLTNLGKYEDKGTFYQFHHIGIIYKVNSIYLLPNARPEEKGCWFLREDLKEEKLTPFAKQIYENQYF